MVNLILREGIAELSIMWNNVKYLFKFLVIDINS